MQILTQMISQKSKGRISYFHITVPNKSEMKSKSLNDCLPINMNSSSTRVLIEHKVRHFTCSVLLLEAEPNESGG